MDQATGQHQGSGPDVRDAVEQWEVVSSETPFTGKVTSLRTDEVRMPDGGTARRDYQVHPGAVAVIALDDDRRVLCLSQYRHPVGRRLWEPPAGLLDVPGEHPLHAAERELYEEAHYRADDWRVLVDFYNSPGSSSEAIRVFLARGLEPAEGERFAAEHEELDMELDWVGLDELVRRILAGQLQSPTLIVGVLALHAALHGTGDGLAALRLPDAPWQARPFRP
ncbi:NUDIX hydrolase [Allostreptomyces psammosilenae]|uniref:ADP-ribose pyrophosphatase n=1 Tax=Allostreptomyces psammosilenae TaxID=1892865 RepID=A0A852ZXM8_9ACTN|nr:NUDIX hydrolase [Allostreptomyces psammosilenae]NYI03391.1 ADP-ribose pyrophosphatase [Allostreptomyces psammosilenae]